MNTPMKRCRVCGNEFPATTEYFRLRKDSPDGLRNECKSCRIAYDKRYYSENSERIKQRASDYYRNHDEKIKRYVRQYYRDNLERVRAYNRQRSPDKHKRFRDKEREWRRTYYLAHKTEHAENLRRWRKQKPEFHRASEHRRRAKKKQVGGTHTVDDVKRLYKAQKGRCYWCGCKVGTDYHVDHVIPLSKGGSNSPENLVIACPHCNDSKGAKLPHEWEGNGGKLL